MANSKRIVEELFGLADIRLGGGRPWDVRVADDRFYDRVLRDGTLGLGESYVLGWWDADDMDELAFKAISARLPERLSRNWNVAWHVARASCRATR